MQFASPCSGCHKTEHSCCDYVIFETPIFDKGLADVAAMGWYLTRMHGLIELRNTHTEDGPTLEASSWEVVLKLPCEHQDAASGKCNIYSIRPQVCSNFQPFPTVQQKDREKSYCPRWYPVKKDGSKVDTFTSYPGFREYCMKKFGVDPSVKSTKEEDIPKTDLNYLEFIDAPVARR